MGQPELEQNGHVPEEHHDDNKYHKHPKNMMYGEPMSLTKARLRSISIVHLSMFIFSLGFSIILTGVLPYMTQLDPPKDKTDEDRILVLYGLAVAANPLGQLVFSPIFGFIANKLQSVRLICILSSISYIIGNILYSTVSLFPRETRIGLLILSRFIIGVSSANVAPMRAYVASATYPHERTRHFSYISAAQSLGFIVGPTLQAAFTPLKCSDANPDKSYLSIDMYTACGWVSVLFGIGALMLFLPVVFQEFDVQDRVRNYTPDGRKKEQVLSRMPEDGGANDVENLAKPDYTVLVMLLFCFWLFFNNFVILETLGTPMCMDEYAWTEQETVLYLGIVMTIGGIISMICFLSVGRLAHKYDERKLLIYLGIIPMIAARLLMFPLPGEEIKYIPPNSTQSLSSVRGLLQTQAHEGNFRYLADPRVDPPHLRNSECGTTEEEAGCSWDWCEDQPKLNLIQFLIGFLAVFFCYPFCISLCQAIFSKMLGPRPQGTWMGALTASGSFARVCGPLFVTFVYNEFGLYVTFAIVEAFTVLSLIIVLIYWKRMVPFGHGNHDPMHNYQERGSEQVTTLSMHAVDENGMVN